MDGEGEADVGDGQRDDRDVARLQTVLAPEDGQDDEDVRYHGNGNWRGRFFYN